MNSVHTSATAAPSVKTHTLGDDISVSSHSMKKWGIPEQRKKSNEATLLERLVWVQYENHWWPALLYQSYSELQTHLYVELDTVLKAQFAMAIMRQMQDKKDIKVARLLGRQILEVVEVEPCNYAEFYWQLPKVLPEACQMSHYGSNVELFLDFHRALDQVEEIIRDVSESSFNLLPSPDNKTWLQRAIDATRSQPSRIPTPPRTQARSVSPPTPTRALPAAPSKEEESSTVFQVMDAVMDSVSRTFDGLTGATGVAKDLSNTAVANATAIAEQNMERGKIPPADSVARAREATLIQNRLRMMMDESRDPSPDDRKFKGRGVQGKDMFTRGDSSSKFGRRSTPEVLPGLEADDIVPGLGDVLRAMNLYAEDQDDNSKDFAPRVVAHKPPAHLYAKDRDDKGKDFAPRVAHKPPARLSGPSYSPVRLPFVKENDEIFMYETEPIIEVTPKKKSAASFTPSRPIFVDEPLLDPVEQRDSAAFGRTRRSAVAGQRSMVEADEETFWEFLTCRS